MKFIKKTQETVRLQTKPTYRQGDVLLQKMDSLPPNCQPVEFDERIVLAYGEVTGHCHAFSTSSAAMFTYNGQRLVQVIEGAQLRHEEHATIVLPKGVYKVIQQREYVPEAPPRDVLD